jgi:hypothetical protein
MPYASSQATFLPAATAHGVADVCGGAKEFKGLSNSSGSAIQIASASLLIENATIETTTWRVYLYGVTPPSALADDAVFDIPSGDRASFLGFIDIAQVVDVGSTQYIQSDNLNKQIRLAGRSAFGYLVNLAALTPNNSNHIVTLFTVS